MKNRKIESDGIGQCERFIEAARQFGTDGDPERFKEVVRKLAKAPVKRNDMSKKHGKLNDLNQR